MKIVILAFPLDNQSAGIHYYTKGMLDGLHQANKEHDITLLRSHHKPEEYPKFKTIVVDDLNWIPAYPSFKLFFVIPYLCWKLKADVVVEPAHFGPFNLPGKTKRVTVIHDLTPILFPELHTFNGWFLQKLFLPRILRKADLIISNSSHTASDLKKTFPFTRGKISTIYPGIDSIFKFQERKGVLEKYGISKPYLLFVGTIEPRKNLTLLLKCFEEIKENIHKEITLVITGGKGWKAKEFHKALTDHPFKNSINLTGYVNREDLPYIYSAAEAMIYPSKYEGFGFPVLEAIACGTPAITLDNSSLKELTNFSKHVVSTSEDNITESYAKLTKEKVKSNLPSWENFGSQMIVELLKLFRD